MFSSSNTYSQTGVEVFGLFADSIQYEKVQDDGGMDYGLGIPESRLELSPTTRYVTAPVTYLSGNVEVKEDTTVFVCHIKTAKPAMDVWTIARGLKKDEALMGRFIFHDLFKRTYNGHAYATEVTVILVGYTCRVT